MAASEVSVVPVDVLSLELLNLAMGAEGVETLARHGRKMAARVGDRTIWNLNSTPTGGGVAEMLRFLVGYMKGLGFNTEWLTIQGFDKFFWLTKRLHNRLHGNVGDGGVLDADERLTYDTATLNNLVSLLERVKRGDIVIVHDPQPAGLIALLKAWGAKVVWRCHIGADEQNALSEEAWEFLKEFVVAADLVVFSRQEYVPACLGLDPAKVRIIRPCIDPTSHKNAPMDSALVASVLAAAGILEPFSGSVTPAFVRANGSLATVINQAILVGPKVPGDRRIVLQVSRWDRLKQMAEVIGAFVEANLGHEGHLNAHLVLAGPNVEGVEDDPEGAAVWEECQAAWRALAPEVRSHVTLVCLPMGDTEENAWIVNALQRRATVVFQMSLVEGFGLTVAEAMWKERPVVATDVGGIREQIKNGKNGTLLVNPRDRKAAGDAMRYYLTHPEIAEEHGREARRTVLDLFLPDTSLTLWGAVILELLRS